LVTHGQVIQSFPDAKDSSDFQTSGAKHHLTLICNNVGAKLAVAGDCLPTACMRLLPDRQPSAARPELIQIKNPRHHSADNAKLHIAPSTMKLSPRN
jgi:hypothetical protein